MRGTLSRSTVGANACGAAAGIIATSCCGTGAVTLALVGLGAGSAVATFAATHNMQMLSVVAFVAAAAIVLGSAYFFIRRERRRLSNLAFRALYVQTLTRTGAWAVGAYLLWFVIVQPITWKFNISIPKAH